MSDKTVILRLQVEGFGTAKNDLEFLTTETQKLTEAKRQQTQEGRTAARVINAEEGSIEKLRAQTALLRQEANNMKAVTAAEIKQRQELTKQIGANTAKIRDHDRAMSGSSTLVGEYERGFAASFKKIGVAIAAFSGAFIAAQGVIRAFKTTLESADSTADMLEQTIGAVKGGVDNLMKSVATGDWSSLLRNMAAAISAGKEYAATLDLIADSGRALGMEEADLLVTQSELEQRVKDVNLSYEERMKAGEDFLLNAKKISVERQRITDDEYNALIKKLAGTTQLTSQQIDNIVRQDDATMKMIEVGQKYIDLTKSMDNAANDSNTARLIEAREERALLGDKAKEYADFVRDYKKLSDDEKDSVVSLYAKKRAAEYAWFTENKRIYTMIGTLTKQVNKEEEKSLTITERKVAVIKSVFGGRASIIEGSITPAADPDVVRQKEVQLAITKAVKTGEGTRTSIMLEEAESRNNILMAEADALMGLGNILASLAGENKGLAIAAVVIQRAAAIAQIISNIAIANVKAIAASPLTMGQPWVAINSISGGIAAAAVVAESIASIGEINKYALSGRIKNGLRVRPDSRGDDTLVVAKQGEVILNSRHQSMLGGAATFKKLGVPGFAGSGMVGSPYVSQSTGSMFDMGELARMLAEGLNEQKVILSLPELETAQTKRIRITQSSPI